ncbi:uncharacterized protein LOC105902698 [Clupea harengus]|uniref:Uncharacterized protein LOC105902698 n=1 Tax=Clupea harengus TaxID=7950 RepID=A0A6P3W0L1_CLUHA|nr:uncharacterized protein LOC105902698 [Clupea harengus]
MASTSTKKHNTLLKKWQKINATDIFRDQGALRSPSSDPLSITGPEELHGSDDGIFVQIQLESAVEPPWSESERKAAGKQEDPRGAGPSSKKPRTSNFRWHRKIVQKGELIEVSRQWTETYDFTLDSKFIKNPRDETVSRALHGPWKFNVNDTEEQIHLIFHMWIGLFYSKTASRFFHLGSDRPPPEEYAAGGDSKSAKDAEPVLSASMSSKSDSVTTNAPDDTTSSSSVKAVPSTRLFEPQLMLQLTDDCSDASGPQCEAQRPPESPPYEVLDLSLKGCKPSDLTAAAAADASAGEEAISDHPGGEQVCGGFEGPLDMRTRAPTELNVTSIISEEPCSTEGTMGEDKNTTTDDVVATSMMMISCKNDCVIKQGDFSSRIGTSKPLDLSGKTLDLFDRFREDHNPVVTQDGKTKYRFFTLVTSEDPFFRKTKEQLEADGHTAVEPEGFELESCSPASPLLIIVRNEDIAEHICEIPHLLELKKSSSVVFAGIDRPDDILNLTHEELFCKGGFLMFDGTSLKKLTLESMKRTVPSWRAGQEGEGEVEVVSALQGQPQPPRGRTHKRGRSRQEAFPGWLPGGGACGGATLP